MKPKARVLCPLHGPVPLDQDQYYQQLRDVDSLWKCPRCGLDAVFDDAFYEKED